MLHLHFSNRSEVLAAQLVQALAGPRADVFEPDTIVIPHAGARRWLQLAMADHQGVCANVRFEYLARWLWEQVARVLPGVSAQSPIEAGSLTWRLLALFQDASFLAGQPLLARYLAAGGDDPVFPYELAARAAPVLEQYATFRPDWLAAWQQGRRVTESPHEAWQAGAWRRIAADLQLGTRHPLEAMTQSLDLVSAARLPASAHLFALPSIPPLYLSALQALARHMELHVYAPSPSREYWFDLVDPKRLDRLREQGREAGFEVGHRLLASWGRQAQASLGLLSSLDESHRTRWESDYRESGQAHLLGRVQDSMLDLQELAPGSIEWREGDRSLEVHACHSLTRELEVLHDRLLGLFRADPLLRPSDVLVVAPDLEAAAPLVDAVFGTAPAVRTIPYAITGRKRSGVNAPVRAFLELLVVASSRCTATQVFALLQQPVVRRRFAMDEAALQQVHAWMIASGIHWGLDAGHVAAQHLPAEVSHTLADGLARLFLGHALPDDCAEPLGGHLPLGGAEGSAAAALGAFWAYVSALRELARDLQQPRTASAWASRLRQAAGDFLQADPREAEDLLALLGGMDRVASLAEHGGFLGELPAAVVRAALEAELGDSPHGGTPTGRVTFTSLASLRHLPFRVVCAVGLSDGAYPTPDRPPEFDLLQDDVRPGDRQRGTDQRNLLLDLLLAARDVVHFSYTGRSVRDNAVLPPSVLLAELLDVLVPAIASRPDDEQSLREAQRRLVVEHPLQPFSPVAFAPDGDPRVRSHDEDLAAALRSALAEPPPSLPAPGEDAADTDEDVVVEPAQPFFAQALSAPGEEWSAIPFARLQEFFRHPARFLLRRRLGIELLRDDPELQDDEPFLPDFEGRSRLAERLLPHLLRGESADVVERLARAGTELPPGAIGEGELQVQLATMGRFAAAVRRFAASEPLPPQVLSVAVQAEGRTWQVEGAFADLRPQGLVRWRYDDMRASDVLAAWLPHLLLCAAAPAGVAPSTTWLSRDTCTVHEPLPREQAHEQLAALVALYARGLSQPLPFFPKSSWELVKTDNPKKARDRWQGSEEWAGESAQPAHALAWRGNPDALGATDFDPVARLVFRGRSVRETALAQVAQ